MPAVKENRWSLTRLDRPGRLLFFGLIVCCWTFPARGQRTFHPDYPKNKFFSGEKTELVTAGFQWRHLRAAAAQLHRISSHRPPAGLPLPAARLSIYAHPTRLPWTVECLPLFCRIEHRMGRRSAVPLKFRLGSVEYVDWLEGK